jgi:antitoxin FitA
MAQVTVRRLDDAVLDKLKARAKANDRSTEAEIREILRAAAEAPVPGQRERSIFDFVGSHPTNRTAEEIVAEIRALRDEGR